MHAVYALHVDTDTYLATKMYALVCGDKDANTDEFNTCNTESIAQPDNLAYVAGHDGLIIGTSACPTPGLLHGSSGCGNLSSFDCCHCTNSKVDILQS
jgi:hypothetical protein